MQWVGREVTFEAAAITTVAAVETIAMLTGKMPTWTSQVKKLPRPLRAVVVGLIVVWAVPHFEILSWSELYRRNSRT